MVVHETRPSAMSGVHAVLLLSLARVGCAVWVQVGAYRSAPVIIRAACEGAGTTSRRTSQVRVWDFHRRAAATSAPERRTEDWTGTSSRSSSPPMIGVAQPMPARAGDEQHPRHGGMHGMAVEIEKNEPGLPLRVEAARARAEHACGTTARNIDVGAIPERIRPPNTWRLPTREMAARPGDAARGEGLVTAKELETGRAGVETVERRSRASEVAVCACAARAARRQGGGEIQARRPVLLKRSSRGQRACRVTRAQTRRIDRDHGVFIFPDPTHDARQEAPALLQRALRPPRAVGSGRIRARRRFTWTSG